MLTGIKVGGVEGPVGQTLVHELANALRHAIDQGQNSVAIAITEQLGRLGQVQGAMVSGCHIAVGA